MTVKQKSKDSLVRDLEDQVVRLKWDIEARTLQISNLVEEQKVQKRKRQLLTDAIKYIKEG